MASFFSKITKIVKPFTAAITSGGSSLLLSKEQQDKLGGGILAGAGAMMVSGAASGLAKGAQPGGGGMMSGMMSGLKSEAQKALSLGTVGSQKLGNLSQWAIDKLGIAGATPTVSQANAPAVAPAGYTRMPGGAMVPISADQGMVYDPMTGATGNGYGGAYAQPAMAGMGPMARWAGTAVGGALGLKALKGLMTSAWGYVSRKKVVAIVKAVGIEAAAVALGVGAVEVAQMIAADAASGTKRRRRGITAADLRRTKATIGKINRMHSQLACLAKTAPRTKRAC